MSLYSPSIEKLIESFERLPSIGHKTAARLAFYILNCSEEETNEFISSITNAKKNLKYCSKCYNISDTDPCIICGSPKRDSSLICVVEDVRDIIAMEKTHEFKGVYHVLHGSISPKLIKPLGITVTRIAHGIPVGGDLEYTDEITLTKALEGRREL